jgi:hypothetical protein
LAGAVAKRQRARPYNEGMTHAFFITLSLTALATTVTTTALADALAPAHGPSAPDDQFPSHRFTLAAHAPERVQLAMHYGLLQPVLLHGFNAAVDVRWRRLVFTYSHGAGLDVTSTIDSTEQKAGMTLREPWTTGGGLGVLLLDELWVLADLKVHHFEPEVGAQRASYETITVGGEIGWRFFVWKGFNIAVVGRYWPNVWSSAQGGVTFKTPGGQTFVHEPAQQGNAGLFANVLVGWAFGL